MTNMKLEKCKTIISKCFEVKLRVPCIWENSQKVDYVAGVVLKVFLDILTLFFFPSVVKTLHNCPPHYSLLSLLSSKLQKYHSHLSSLQEVSFILDRQILGEAQCHFNDLVRLYLWKHVYFLPGSTRRQMQTFVESLCSITTFVYGKLSDRQLTPPSVYRWTCCDPHYSHTLSVQQFLLYV